MEIITDSALLAHIEGFLARHSMAQSRFGRETMGDGSLVQHLRDGRSLSLKNAERVLTWMADFESALTTEQAA